MGFYDGAMKELRGKLKAIFENNEYAEKMESEEGQKEFQFTGEANYSVKVEDDGDYKEYYVSDEDGNIIEIFTDEMLDQDGRLPSSIRQEIAAQAQDEVGEEFEADEEDEEVGEEVGEEVEDEDEYEDEEEVEDPEVVDTEQTDLPEDLPEDYTHNLREEKDYDDEQGEVPGEQDTGPDEHQLDDITGSKEEVISKAKKLINTDRYQVQDVIEKVPQSMRDDVLAALRRTK